MADALQNPAVGLDTPVRLSGLAWLNAARHLLRDPLEALSFVRSTHGPFVVFSDPTRIIVEWKSFALAAGAKFNREVLTNPDIWRTVRIAPGGPFDSAARRLSFGIIRMRGRQHAYYRRLIASPLARSNVESRGGKMADLATEAVDTWPVGEPIDLADRSRWLVRSLGIGLLFGDDRTHGYPVSKLIGDSLEYSWSPAVAACPINLPFTPYGKMLRGGEAIERQILDWATCVRGRPDAQNLLSLIVNSPDEDGDAVGPETVVGQMPTLIAATYETCQNALIWTLILLAQHPRIARDLCDEIEGALSGSPPTLDKISALPLLDAVVKESMRLLPPVPVQFRVAEQDTTLAGHAVPQGLRVILSAFLTNREPGLYGEPDQFRPERWQTINPTPFEYPVFGAGLHGCPGLWFGLGVVKTTLAEILTRFRVSLLPQSIDYKVRVTMSPRLPVMAVLQPQDRAFAPVKLSGGITKIVRFQTDG